MYNKRTKTPLDKVLWWYILPTMILCDPFIIMAMLNRYVAQGIRFNYEKIQNDFLEIKSSRFYYDFVLSTMLYTCVVAFFVV
jgi:hypothetical protein